MKRDAFSLCHPIVNFSYFLSVLAFTMFFMQPVCLLISFFCSLMYYFTLFGKNGAHTAIKTVLPVTAFASVMNPLFSHSGKTILLYFPSGNPLTLESIVYGLFSGVMLASVLIWFICLSAVFTEDKFIYLFSRLSPSLSLLISMTLRFIPDFRRRFESARDVQSFFVFGEKSYIQKAKTAVSGFVAAFSQSIENAAVTAESMKSRGYGAAKRSSYTVYRMDGRDRAAQFFIMFCVFFIVCGSVSGAFSWRYYPDMSGALTEKMTVMLYIAYFSLCIMPVYLDRKEKREWKHSQSKI